MAHFRINPVKDKHPGYIVAVDFVDKQLTSAIELDIHFDKGWGEGLESLNTVTREAADFIVDRNSTTSYTLTAGSTGLLAGSINLSFSPRKPPKETVIEIVHKNGHVPFSLETLIWEYNRVAKETLKLTTTTVKDFQYRENMIVIAVAQHHPFLPEDTEIVVRLVNLCD